MAVAANKNPRVCAPESPKNSLAGYELKKYNPMQIPNSIAQK